MNPFKAYKEAFRRYPLARFLTFALAVALGFLAVILSNLNVSHLPVITGVDPSVGMPGDVMVISGQYFGDERGTSYVEIAGSRLTASGYLDWGDEQIRIVLPANVQDGLVIVGTAAGRSEPGFFANESGIPVAVQSVPKATLPVIRSVTPQRAYTGQTVTITGSNFGDQRGTSKVCFSAAWPEDAQNPDANFVPASAFDYDYESWTDTEIRLHVPDGAATGSVFVQTQSGRSVAQKFTVDTSAGQKVLSGKRTYIIQVGADIANAVAGADSHVTLYVPRPATSAWQPVADLTEYSPEPLELNDIYDVVHRRPLGMSSTARQRFTHTFVVSTYTVTNNIKRDVIPARYSDTTRLLYQRYVAADAVVPSDSQAVRSLLAQIVGNETSPYRRAVMVYNYMLSHYRIQDQVRSGNVSVLDMIQSGTGDAYDFAILFTALCRASGVPSVPVGGILVQSDSTCKPHWWTELYFERYGWFPADIALGAGLSHKPFVQVQNPASYYWGNLDSQHVAFSRGWHQIRQAEQGSKTVYRPRTYALQSIWEEASAGTVSYSSLWNDPIVKGIY